MNDRKSTFPPYLPASLFLFALFLALSCSSEKYVEEADKDVYEIIEEKQAVVLGETAPFSIDKGDLVEDVEKEARKNYTEDEEETDGGVSGLPENTLEELMKDPFFTERINDGCMEVDLDTALETAFRRSRDFKSRKEDLYLDALALTLQRHLWTPIFSGGLTADAKRSAADNRYVSGGSSFSVSQIFSTGGEITVGLASDIMRIYSPNHTNTASSLFSIDVLQPLWRGSGSLVAQENLTQAERNVAYEIRSFDRYRKSLARNIASSYYNVLQQKDSVVNSENNFESRRVSRERSEAMYDSGRLEGFEVDQARQRELEAENSLINAVQSHDQMIDSFKVQLGLPMEIELELDANDLTVLSEMGLTHPKIDLDRAIAQALENRLDLLNAGDQLQDARRQVLLAEDGLGPDLDLNLEYSVGTEGPKNALKFETNHPTYGAGLDLNLPLDRKSERNALRQALISLEREKRGLSLLEDSVVQDVRQSFRKLNQAKESYEIQKVALDLSKKRVESTNILVQAGRAQTRELLESQDDLLVAQNALTSAIVNHTIARMDFLLDIEAMRVDGSGHIVSLDADKADPVEHEEKTDDEGTEDDSPE